MNWLLVITLVRVSASGVICGRFKLRDFYTGSASLWLSDGVETQDSIPRMSVCSVQQHAASCPHLLNSR